MGVGIAYAVDIRNAWITGASVDSSGHYGGGYNTCGFDGNIRGYLGLYHWPVHGDGGNTDTVIQYIKHERSGNTIYTHHSEDAAAAQDPGSGTWTQAQTATINSTDHCKPVWGEASNTSVIDLEITYVNVTGDYNFL